MSTEALYSPDDPVDPQKIELNLEPLALERLVKQNTLANVSLELWFAEAQHSAIIDELLRAHAASETDIERTAYLHVEKEKAQRALAEVHERYVRSISQTVGINERIALAGIDTHILVRRLQPTETIAAFIEETADNIDSLEAA